MSEPHRPWSSRASARLGAATTVGLLLAGLVTGCSGSARKTGASTTQVGPTIETTPFSFPAHGSGAGAAGSSTKTKPADFPTHAQQVISKALAASGHQAANVTVQQPSGQQVVVAWTVTQKAADLGAKARVRKDAALILALFKQVKRAYGSVVLVASAAVKNGKAVKTIKVVRVTYPQKTVQSTDWAHVPPAAVFQRAGDKQASIYPTYR